MVDVDKERLKELFVEQGMTKIEVSEELGIGRGTVRRRVNKWDLKRIYEDEKRLRHLYVERGLSTPEIADMFNSGTTSIQRGLDRFDIETRQSHRDKPPCFFEREDGYEEWVHGDGNGTKHVYVHRLLAVAHYGYQKTIQKDVHHINEVPWDNRPENIELLTNEEHGRLHGVPWA